MIHSATYLTLKSIMESGRLVMEFSELVRWLAVLEEEGLISEKEHQALFELAGKWMKPHPSRSN